MSMELDGYEVKHGDDTERTGTWPVIAASRAHRHLARDYWATADEPPAGSDEPVVGDGGEDGGGPPDDLDARNWHTAFDFHLKFILAKYQGTPLTPVQPRCGICGAPSDIWLDWEALCAACYLKETGR